MTDSPANPQPHLEALPDLTASSSQTSPSIPEPPSLSKWFLGPEGLRPGWGFLLYLALGFALMSGARFLLHPVMHRLTATLWRYLVQESAVLVSALVPAVAMSRIEKRPFGSYGLPARGAFGKAFAWGVVWGLVALSLLLLTLRGSGVFYFGSAALHGIRVIKFALFFALLFLLVAFFEEFLFRGYTLFTLSRGITFWPAAVGLSLLFGGVHLSNVGESWRGALSAALIGLFFCFTVRRTGNLWFAVGMHASWDWAETYFYGVPDSGTTAPGHYLNASFHGPAWLTGGTVGPEGSVLVFVLIAAMFVVFQFMYPARDAEASSANRSI